MAPASRKRRTRGPAASPSAPGVVPVHGAVGAAVPSRSERRDAEARGALKPLARGERPPALIVATALALLIAAGVVVGASTVHDLARRGGSVPGAAFLATVLVVLGVQMWRQRYWAVLAFEALLAFQVLVTALALLVAETLYAAIICVVGISLSGWLFWKLIRVMGRLQAPAAADEAAPR